MNTPQHTAIVDHLAKLERLKRVSVLFAIESGSRAWGFASQDSDFDIRFVYLNRLDEYLRVRPVRDVIENDDVKNDLVDPNLDLDFSGFDLRKFFDLMLKSNPSVFEWLASPTVYYETAVNHLWQGIREVSRTCFSPKAALHHYVSMARHNYREHMRDGASATVKLKKYLYICRPLLCGQAILENGGLPPPMPFNDVVGMAARGPNASVAVRNDLLELVERKRAGDELMAGPVVPEINAWIEAEIPRLKAEADRASVGTPSIDALDEIFSYAVRFGQDSGIGCDQAERYHAALDRGEAG